MHWSRKRYWKCQKMMIPQCLRRSHRCLEERKRKVTHTTCLSPCRHRHILVDTYPSRYISSCTSSPFPFHVNYRLMTGCSFPDLSNISCLLLYHLLFLWSVLVTVFKSLSLNSSSYLILLRFFDLALIDETTGGGSKVAAGGGPGGGGSVGSLSVSEHL